MGENDYHIQLPLLQGTLLTVPQFIHTGKLGTNSGDVDHSEWQWVAA